MASERSIASQARKQTGTTDESKWSDGFLLNEVEKGKQEINREVEERVSNGSSVDIFDDENASNALLNFVSLRMEGHKQGGKEPPSTVSEINRYNFDNSAMSEQARKLTYHLGKLFDDGN